MNTQDRVEAFWTTYEGPAQQTTMLNWVRHFNTGISLWDGNQFVGSVVGPYQGAPVAFKAHYRSRPRRFSTVLDGKQWVEELAVKQLALDISRQLERIG